MAAAPEMSPSLDDALRAIDGAHLSGVMDRRQLATIRGFLEQLEALQKGPRMVIDARVLSEILEAAHLAGARFVDGGQVLAMRVPVFIECLMAAQTAERTAPGRFRRWLSSLVADCPPNCPECTTERKI